MRRIALSLVLLACAAACSMPETRIYSLNADAGPKAAAKQAPVAVSVRVQSPRYLAQPYIVERVSPNQLAVSRYGRWEGTPEEMVKGVLRDALRPRVREVTVNRAVVDAFALNVEVKRFEKSIEGKASSALLILDYSLVGPDQSERFRSTCSRKIALQGADNQEFARAMGEAVASAAEEIAATVSERLR